MAWQIGLMVVRLRSLALNEKEREEKEEKEEDPHTHNPHILAPGPRVFKFYGPGGSTDVNQLLKNLLCPGQMGFNAGN